MDAPPLGLFASSLSTAARAVAALAVAGPDAVRLARKVSLLVHLFDEIADFAASGDRDCSSPSSPSSSSVAAPNPERRLKGLLQAVRAVGRFLSRRKVDSDQASKSVSTQFQYVTWQLEKALGALPYDYFDISDDVREQVDLVRSQLRRATEKNGFENLGMFTELYNILTETGSIETNENIIDVDGAEISLHSPQRGKVSENETVYIADTGIQELVDLIAEVNIEAEDDLEALKAHLLQQLSKSELADSPNSINNDISLCDLPEKTSEEPEKSDPLQIPEDFRCPISLELMRDPVIVSTGQTYERSSIQRWIDCGNKTCPKTQQKLNNLTLTPNYVLRSLIMQWCEANHPEQPHILGNGRIRKSDGTYIDVSGDRAVIWDLVRRLSNGPLEEQRSSVAEIRSLAKRSTENRILIAEAGAIPILIHLLSADDEKIQEHAVTAILNLSIYDTNKGLIMFGGAVTPIIQVLRSGSMEARENAAAAIFSLSLIDENKRTIGSTPGAIDELVGLLKNGSTRGRKDAATALFNLCIYQGNKSRAMKAGILGPLHEMLTSSSNSNGMVDEALTILSVLVSHPEGKVAIKRANLIPVLIDLLRTVQPRNKENATAILLALCKKNHDNLACITRLGALLPLTDLSKNGTDRAKRKANSLLELMSKLDRL